MIPGGSLLFELLIVFVLRAKSDKTDKSDNN